MNLDGGLELLSEIGGWLYILERVIRMIIAGLKGEEVKK